MKCQVEEKVKMKLISEMKNSKAAAKGNKQQINSFNMASPAPVRQNRSSQHGLHPSNSEGAAGRPRGKDKDKDKDLDRDRDRDRPQLPTSADRRSQSRPFERDRSAEQPLPPLPHPRADRQSSADVLNNRPLFIDTNLSSPDAGDVDGRSPLAGDTPGGYSTMSRLSTAGSSTGKGGLLARANTGISLQRVATMTTASLNGLNRAGTLSRSMSMDVAAKETLPVGLIDYFLVIGPTSIPCPEPNESPKSTASSRSFGANSSLRRMSGTHPSQQATGSGPSTGASLDGDPFEAVQVGTVEVDLWDRFPKEDHEDVPLPMKVRQRQRFE